MSASARKVLDNLLEIDTMLIFGNEAHGSKEEIEALEVIQKALDASYNRAVEKSIEAAKKTDPKPFVQMDDFEDKDYLEAIIHNINQLKRGEV